MNITQLRKRVEAAFQDKEWAVQWNEEEETIIVTLGEHKETFRVSLPKLQQRMAREKKKADEVIAELVEQATTIYQSIGIRENVNLRDEERNLFPVMRSTSFPTETPNGHKLICQEHTAETMIFYALDLGKSYTLIDEEMLKHSGWSKQELHEKSLFNLRGLKHEVKQDQVAGNVYYFISPTDGYGASRILNQALLQEFANKVEGDFCLAIPHQDVLILADIRNKIGYDVLGQMVLTFYRQGNMPITMLPFDYNQGELEPIFILASKK